MELCEKNCTLEDYILELKQKKGILTESHVMNIIKDILSGLYEIN